MHRRPIAVTGLVAAASLALLTAAITWGWLGPDVGRGDNFCELAHSGLIKQPANTLSNLGFVVTGLLVALHASRREEAEQVGHVMSRQVATAYACVVVLLGPASAAMHATQSAWGGHLDLLSMYLIASFAAAWAWTRWTRRGPRAFATAYAGSVLACELVGLWPRPVPIVHYAGNVAFAALLVTATVLEVRLWQCTETTRTIAYGVVATASMVVAFTIWLISTNGWCDPDSIWQGHAAWHLLCAVAAYWLYRLYASERAFERQWSGPPLDPIVK